jgi:hypothetical protein
MLDFTKPLTGLDGSVIKDETGKDVSLGKLLSGQLANTTKGDALKLFTWAQKCYNNQPLDLDPSDRATLKDFINASENLTVLAKAQLLNVFN